MEIEGKNIFLDIGDIPILKGANFTFCPGKLYALVGKNGAGKSTFLKFIRGYHSTFNGELILDGNVVARETGITREIFTRMAYLPQDPTLSILGTTVAEECILKMENLNIAPATMDELLIQSLTRSNLWDKRDYKVDWLSGGELQKLAFCTIMLGEPEVLLLDEPTSMLDSKSRIEFLQLLLDWQRQAGRLVIFISHYYEELIMATHIYHLDDCSLKEQTLKKYLESLKGTGAQKYKPELLSLLSLAKSKKLIFPREFRQWMRNL
ncbi:ABC transporter ATP-binding protein [Candidatus Riflebacteria bacterium]